MYCVVKQVSRLSHNWPPRCPALPLSACDDQRAGMRANARKYASSVSVMVENGLKSNMTSGHRGAFWRRKCVHWTWAAALSRSKKTQAGFLPQDTAVLSVAQEGREAPCFLTYLQQLSNGMRPLRPHKPPKCWDTIPALKLFLPWNVGRLAQD